MHGLYSKLIKPIHFSGDIVAVNFSFFISYYLVYGSHDNFVDNHYFSLLIFYNAAWIVLTLLLKPYQFGRTQPYTSLLSSIFRFLFFFILAQEIFNRWVTVFNYPHSFFIYTYISIALLLPLWRLTTILALRIYRKRGFNFKRVVLVCSDSNSCSELKEFFDNHPEHGYRILRIFNIRKHYSGTNDLMGELKDYCTEKDIDEIYCSYSPFNGNGISDLMDFANKNLIRVKFLPDVFGFTMKQFNIEFYDYIPVFAVKPTPLDDPLNKIFKRAFDITFSFVVMVFLFSWLAPLIALFIKLDSRGNVIFRQRRNGLDNKEFWCYKFRTMYNNHEADITQATGDDSRITKIGSFLRKTSLDELPQFINVFLGDMSVVGPRPHMVWHTEYYSEIIKKYMLRHFIKPGITGLAQVKGYRGETSDPALMERRIKMDVFYMENWSFFLDLKIIFLTLFKLQDDAPGIKKIPANGKPAAKRSKQIA